MRVIVITDDSVNIPENLPYLTVPPDHNFTTENIMIGGKYYRFATVKFELQE